MTPDTSKLHGKCRPCNHVFLVAQLPMPFAGALQALRSACCPRCGTNKDVVVARAHEVTDA